MSSFSCECGRLLDPAWSYCSECGRHAGRVVLCEATLEKKVADGAPNECALSLENLGTQPIAYQAWIDPAGPIELAGSGSGNVFPGPQNLTLRIRDVPPADRPVSLHLRTFDGPRPAADPWAEPEARSHPPVPITVERVAPPRLRIQPELAFLTDDVRSRDLDLLNEGEAEVLVTLPELPSGIVYLDPAHRARTTLPVPARGVTVVPVGLRGFGRNCVSGACFTTSTEESLPVHFARHCVEDEILPAYIVGIDFGTRNSSVFVRRTGGPGIPEETLSAGDHEGLPRFPSALYRDRVGGWHFGGEALRKAGEEDRQSDVIRNVKRLIYGDEEPFLPRGEEFSSARLLRRFLAHVYTLADRHIAERYGQRLREVEAQFVLSVPVLDDERRLRMERGLGEAMRQVLGLRDEPLENRVVFAPEPVCAALFILRQGESRDLAANGDVPAGSSFRNGDRIVVFDSGGGTTDVVVGQVELTGGRLAFRIEHQVGLTESSSTFGGNDVNHALVNPRDGILSRRVGLFEHLTNQNLSPEQAFDYLTEAIDPVKIGLVRNGEMPGSLNDVVALPDSIPIIQRTLTMEDLTLALLGKLDDVLDPVRTQLFEGRPLRLEREDIRYVFLVGGNTLLPPMRTALRNLFQLTDGEARKRLAILPEEATMTAVARGSVNVPDTRLRNSSLYGLRLLRTGAAGEEELWSFPADAALTAGKIQRMRAFAGSPLHLRLEGALGDTRGLLVARTLEPPGDARQCHLQVELHVGEQPALEVRYSIDPQGSARYENLLFRYAI
jgi:hypothetical protein